MARPFVKFFLCILSIYLLKKAEACTSNSLITNLPVLMGDAFQRAATQGTENPMISMVQHQIVCLTTGATRGTYSSASVIASFLCSGLACPNSGNLQQFEFECDASASTNMWAPPSDPPPNFVVPIGNLTTSRRTDCGLCVQDASGLGSRFDTVTHCVACDSSCNTGLMECTGISGSDCCIGVMNNTCVPSCTAPARPLNSAGYECTVFCDPLSDPDNGNIIFSSELLVGSVATYSCGPNFEIQGDINRTCEVVGSTTMWSGSAPSCMMVVTEEPTMQTEEPTDTSSATIVTSTDMATEEPTVPDDPPSATTGTRVTVSPSDSTDNGLSTGAIIGIVIAAVVLVLIIAVVIVGVLVYWIRD